MEMRVGRFLCPILPSAVALEYERRLYTLPGANPAAAMADAGLTLGNLMARNVAAFGAASGSGRTHAFAWPSCIQTSTTTTQPPLVAAPSEVYRLVVLCGRGNNTGDALYAAAAFAQTHPGTQIWLLLTASVDAAGLTPALSLLETTCGAELGTVRRLAASVSTSTTGAPDHDCDDVSCAYAISAATPTVSAMLHPPSLTVRMIDAEGANAARAMHEATCDGVTVGHYGRTVRVVVLDGIFGMQFRPPLRGAARRLVDACNAFGDPLGEARGAEARDKDGAGPVGVAAGSHPAICGRFAVDVPSGVGDGGGDPVPFRADTTYATGILKAGAVTGGARTDAAVGRLRFIDLNFFAPSVRDAVLRAPPAGDAVDAAVLRREVLTPSAGFVVGGGILRRPPRPACGEKRAHGHLLLVGGSVAMPGAILMCVAAALRSGVGLVTACVPAPVCSTAAAALPEAMWVPVAVCPETGEMRDADAVLAAASSKKCTAMLVGPGVGRSSDETTAFLCRLVGECEAPVVALDADALQPPVVAAAVRAAGPQRITIVTPHAGEAKRVLAGVAAAATGTSEAKGAAVGGADVNDAVIGTAVRAAHGIFVQKSHRTWVHFLGSAAAEPDAPAHQGAGEREGRVCKALCPHGGPVLSRGGSGDLLAGLIAGAAAAAVAAVGSTAAAAVPRAAYDGVVEATLRAVCEHGAAADAVAEARGEAHAQVTDILSHL